MSNLSPEEVEAIANLARLALTDAEKTQLQDQLSAILDYVEALQELDTDDIPPTASAIPLHNVMRPDQAESSLPVEKALANAPEQAENQFKVKPIL